jgi:hypothetical protein
MKKLLFVVLMFLAGVVVAAENCNVNFSNYKLVKNDTYYAVTISSQIGYTIGQSTTAIKRQIFNNSAIGIFYASGASTTTVKHTGQKIAAGATLTETDYFGHYHIIADSAAVTAEVRIRNLEVKQ